MKALQKVKEERNKKLNKIEKVKELKNPQEAFEKLQQYATDGYNSIPDEDKKYFLKCFGIYDRPATPQRFMLKLRTSGGYINATQAKVIGECAKEFGEDYIDLTTRQQCELRYLRIEDLPSIIKRLEAVGIDGYQTGVDNIRSIMTDPLDEMAFDNVLPSHNTLLKLQNMFLYKKEWISTLPRKFNTAITGSFSNRCNAYCHDISFVLAQKDGIFGYNMFLGGKVGVVGKNADIFLKNEEEVLSAFSSTVNIFKEYGFRDNRNKNRLHFLIESVGIQEFTNALRKHSNIDFAHAGESMTQIDFSDSEQGKVQLRNGSFGVHVVVPSGVFSGSALIEAARLSEVYGDSNLRLDMEQSFYIMGVKDVNSLVDEDFFKTYKNVNTPYLNHLIACAGTQHCPFGVIENKNDAINMSKYLDEKVPLTSGRLRMYWSACVKGCGIHGLGDIGFEGCKAKVDGETVGGVHISLGGKIASEGVEGYTVIKSAPLIYAKYYVESLMLEYKKLRLKEENFEKFHDRLLSKYSSYFIGFVMQLQAYLRSKNIEIELNLAKSVLTGRNEEFELFELGRKLYYQLSKEEAYSAYARFTNENKREELQSIKKLVPNLDENLAIIIDKMLDKESSRAVVFSELLPYVTL
jgi:ferredoxin-nitrite reductase